MSARAYQYQFKPCPFHVEFEMVDTTTGPHDVSPVMGQEGIAFFVVCPVCNCRGPMADSPDEAMILWNARVDKEPDAEESKG